MASLFEHLSETMPLTAAIHAATARFNHPFSVMSIAELKRFCRYLNRDEDFEARLPPLPKRPPFLHDPVTGDGDRTKTNEWAQEQPLWSWKHVAAEPHRVTDIWCRVRHAGYGSFKVLDELQWGVDEGEAGFKNAVHITTSSGLSLELPLTAEYVHQKWAIHAGWIPEDATRLWQLEMLVDRSLVVAFSYDVDPDSGRLIPTRHAKRADDSESEAIDIEKRALEDMRGWADQVPDETLIVDNRGSERRPVDIVVPWAQRIAVNGGYMFLPFGSGLLSGKTGDTVTASASAARILVVLTLTCCKERADYEPGGVVGMARILPHILVKSSVPLDSIRATAKLVRPKSTTKREPWDGWENHARDCCLAYDRGKETIGTLLTADENKNLAAFPASLGPVLPFWGNMFSMTLPDAFDRLGSERLHVVRNDRTTRRSISPYLNRGVVLGGDKADSPVEKMPRQGACDNVHMAPRLELCRASKVTVLRSIGSNISSEIFPIHREALAMTDVVMAPFCAHDCFHMHWRWGEHASSKWAKGWSAASPYVEAGAALVPLNQDVWVWMEAPNVFCYHTEVGAGKDAYFIDDHIWQVILHQGASYAVSTVGYITDLVAKYAVTTFAHDEGSGQVFKVQDESGAVITESNSTSLFYWSLRYKLIKTDVGVTMEPRVIYEPSGLRAFMDR